MNKLLLILVPVVLLGVGVALVMTGIINVPGISPKAKKNAAAMYAKDKEPLAQKPLAPPAKPVVVAAGPVVKPPVATTKIVPEKGAKRVAAVWNEIDVKKLIPIVADWKDEEVVKVLARMDEDKVAELIGAMDAKRASRLSRALQKDASTVVVTSPASG